MDNIYLCRKSANEGDINVGIFAGGRKECHLANEGPGSVHKTGGFRLSGGVESWTSPTLVSVKFASNRDSAVLPSGIASSDIYG
ncbi:hypothetical protein AVEN_236850-1 [Araneus ventricosus]|uniref:Uncharacterized protein n=1 Tax=Araneus ventricosus TaxID=182803 RepID=A0A4Y1ZKE5_ARAVE|nr:hypothetical protein AVEN_236850-1 [Araneus ventricosus]